MNCLLEEEKNKEKGSRAHQCFQVLGKRFLQFKLSFSSTSETPFQRFMLKEGAN